MWRLSKSWKRVEIKGIGEERDIYKYSDKEISEILKTAIVVVDTRERKCSHITDYFEQKKIPYVVEKLNFGDYTIKTNCFNSCREFYLQDVCTIERKANLNELSGNLAHERERIEKEFMRSNGNIFLLIENATYEDILLHNYDTKYAPKSFMATLKTFESRYGLNVHFQKDNTYSGQYIYQTLIYHLREQLIKGVF